MTGQKPTTDAGAEEPSIGPWVPTAFVHVAFVVVAVGVCLLVLDRRLFRRAATVSDLTFYLLLAGVHLLHLLRGVAALVPWHGRLQVSALRRPFQRFLCVQSVVQPVACGALFTFGGGHGTVRGLSLLSAAVLAVVASVFARTMRKTVARR